MLILRPEFYPLYWLVRAPARRRPPGLTWELWSPRGWRHMLTWVAFWKASEASKPLCHFQNTLGFQKFKPHLFTARLKLLNAFIVCVNETQPPETQTSVRFSFIATTSPLSWTLWLQGYWRVYQGSENGDLAADSGQWIVQCSVDADLQESKQYLHGHRLLGHGATSGAHSLCLTLLSWVSVLQSTAPADVPEETLFRNSKLRRAPVAMSLVLWFFHLDSGAQFPSRWIFLCVKVTRKSWNLEELL